MCFSFVFLLYILSQRSVVPLSLFLLLVPFSSSRLPFLLSVSFSAPCRVPCVVAVGRRTSFPAVGVGRPAKLPRSLVRVVFFRSPFAEADTGVNGVEVGSAPVPLSRLAVLPAGIGIVVRLISSLRHPLPIHPPSLLVCHASSLPHSSHPSSSRPESFLSVKPIQTTVSAVCSSDRLRVDSLI